MDYNRSAVRIRKIFFLNNSCKYYFLNDQGYAVGRLHVVKKLDSGDSLEFCQDVSCMIRWFHTTHSCLLPLSLVATKSPCMLLSHIFEGVL